MYPGSSDNAKVSLAMGSLNGREKLHNIKKKGTGMDSNHTPNNKTNEFIVVPLREKKNFHEFYVASTYYYRHRHHNHQEI